MKSPVSITRLARRAACTAFVTAAALIPAALATNLTVDTATEKSTGFTNGTASPFYTCTTLPVNAGVVTTLNGQPCIKFTWNESAYNGTRTARGTEACSTLQVQKEVWFGFYIYLPNPGYPMNKKAGVAQWFANNSACNSWAGMLDLENNDLTVSHRGNCGTGTTAVVYPNFPRNRWVSVITHVVTSHLNNGRFEIYIDGALRYSATGINFGFDTWTAADALQSPNHIGLKIGQYNFDSANYTDNETRTSYYTNVTQVLGNPTGVMNYIRYPEPGIFTYQAETAVTGGGTVIEAVNTGYRGTGYANLPATGGTVTFNNVNGGTGGTKTLDIRNALGVAARTGQLVVNGVTTNITFATTSNWSTWATKSVTVNLNAGTANTIQLRSNGQDLANIDEITIR
jgi:hypothetical protein